MPVDRHLVHELVHVEATLKHAASVVEQAREALVRADTEVYEKQRYIDALEARLIELASQPVPGAAPSPEPTVASLAREGVISEFD